MYLHFTQANKQQIICTEVTQATSFHQRLIGLMFKNELQPQSTLWISSCNSIHTCFMKFAIDCIFVDKNLIVKAIYHDIKPWRMTRFVWGADSVFELPSGTLQKFSLQVGDQLHVGN